MPISGLTGWFAAAGRVVGTLENWRMEYDWDRRTFERRGDAIAYGFGSFGTDDFNIGRVENGVLTWWGWMDEEHPPEDRAEVAAALDLRMPEAE